MVMTVGDSLSFFMSLLVILVCSMGLVGHIVQAGTRNPDNILSFVFGMTIMAGVGLILNLNHGGILDFDL